MKKPVYLLKSGDAFLGEDQRWWTVETVTEPSDFRSNLQIGEKPKPFEVRAKASGQQARTFYYPSGKLLEVR